MAAISERSAGVIGAVPLRNLKYLVLVKRLDHCLADGLGHALGDVLVEVEEAAGHGDLGIGAEVSAGAINDILAVGVDDGGIERVIGCPLTYKPVEAVVLAGTGGIVAQQVVP